MEIAYSLSGFVRVIQIHDRFYEVQAKSIRGESKVGSLVFWKRIYGAYELSDAIKLMESHCS